MKKLRRLVRSVVAGWQLLSSLPLRDVVLGEWLGYHARATTAFMFPAPDSTCLAEHFRTIRELRGWTKTRLASEARASGDWVLRVERGQGGTRINKLLGTIHIMGGTVLVRPQLPGRCGDTQPRVTRIPSANGEPGVVLREGQEISQQIRRGRKALGISQAQLANQIGASRQWVGRIESRTGGQRLEKVLQSLAVVGLELCVVAPAARWRMWLDYWHRTPLKALRQTLLGLAPSRAPEWRSPVSWSSPVLVGQFHDAGR